MDRIKILSSKKLDPPVLKALNGSFDIREQEFIFIEPILTDAKRKEVESVLNTDNACIAFTSSSSANTLSKLLENQIPFPETGFSIFGISGKTQAAIKKIFPEDVIITADNARDLAEEILLYKPKHVLFFCGDRRRDELPDILDQHHVVVQEIVLYHTREIPVTVEDNFDAVLFFSPSAVNSFFTANNVSERTVLFSIGNTTAETIRSLSDKNEIVISEQPSQASLLAAVKKYFKITGNAEK
jgi:uroporphyrinogen-III synthase